MAAFGAGALIAALSVELVAPAVMDLHTPEGSGHSRAAFFALLIGGLAGGLLYVLLDQLVNAQGGFLRKSAASLYYLRLGQHQKSERLAKELDRFSVLHQLPEEHLHRLTVYLKPILFTEGDAIAKKGASCQRMLFLFKGQVRLSRYGNIYKTLGPGDTLGVIPLLKDLPMLSDAVALGVVEGVSLSKAHFETLRAQSPAFDQAVRELSVITMDELEQLLAEQHTRLTDWQDRFLQAVRENHPLPSSRSLNLVREEHQGAGLAVWLGMVIDGIPESFVIGSGVLAFLLAHSAEAAQIGFWQVVPFTLIAGLFLSNFPEALSSSSSMKAQGWAYWKILAMWISLMLIAGIGSGVGFLLADSMSHITLALCEGLAAGAMLTMIAAALIPEAAHLGNPNAVGYSTLLGFLAAISFSLLEG